MVQKARNPGILTPEFAVQSSGAESIATAGIQVSRFPESWYQSTGLTVQFGPVYSLKATLKCFSEEH